MPLNISYGVGKERTICKTRWFLGTFPKLQIAAISFVMSARLSVRPSTWKDLVPTGRVMMKFCVIILRSVVLGMRNVSDKSYRENQNTHFVFNNFFPENRAVC